MSGTAIEERQERSARNQAWMREVNEGLEGAIGTLSIFHGFICECAIPECSENLSLARDEYEQVRSVPTHFAVRPGHVLPDVERVVAEVPGRYVVVDKIEVAGEVAFELDPRRHKGHT